MEYPRGKNNSYGVRRWASFIENPRADDTFSAFLTYFTNHNHHSPTLPGTLPSTPSAYVRCFYRCPSLPEVSACDGETLVREPLSCMRKRSREVRWMMQAVRRTRAHGCHVNTEVRNHKANFPTGRESSGKPAELVDDNYHGNHCAVRGESISHRSMDNYGDTKRASDCGRRQYETHRGIGFFQ